MRKLIFIFLLAAISVTSGCKLIKENPEVVKAVLRLGLKIATYTLVAEKPGAAQHIQTVAGILANPIDSISPDALRKRVEDAIKDDVENEIYRRAIMDLMDEAMVFYKNVYDKHSNELSQAEFVLMIQAMGDSMMSGLTPSIPAHGAHVKETRTALIIIE